jgi:hypothetical protein
MTGGLIVLVIFALLVLVIIAKTAIVVPQQSAYVVERLGRSSAPASTCCCRSWIRSATATR